VYLAEIDIGKVKLGDAARVYVDSFPDRPFEAVVTEIANKAEFTPKDVHMPDERTTLVYGVKLEIRNPEGVIKPGMPASALIRWKPDVPWP
jgi:HlyD family secretion protein